MKQKEREDHMQTSDSMRKLIISYTCPDCNSRVERELPFIKNDTAKTNYESSWWCNFQWCEARHRMAYKVKHKEGKKPQLRVEKFTSNEEVFNKRFQLLEWSGMET
jgi:ABC-type antimicrobial peptide transport system ATPase subunit